MLGGFILTKRHGQHVAASVVCAGQGVQTHGERM